MIFCCYDATRRMHRIIFNHPVNSRDDSLVALPLRYFTNSGTNSGNAPQILGRYRRSPPTTFPINPVNDFPTRDTGASPAAALSSVDLPHTPASLCGAARRAGMQGMSSPGRCRVWVLPSCHLSGAEEQSLVRNPDPYGAPQTGMGAPNTTVLLRVPRGQATFNITDLNAGGAVSLIATHLRLADASLTRWRLRP